MAAIKSIPAELLVDSGFRQRFWAKVDKSGECWPWIGSRLRGYGQIACGRFGTFRAHRIAYTLSVGDIPAGLTLDHLCRNPACCNPEHLEPVTNAVNVLRGVGLTAQNAQKVYCKRGHLLTTTNVRRRRDCQKCRNERQNGYRTGDYVECVATCRPPNRKPYPCANRTGHPSGLCSWHCTPEIHAEKCGDMKPIRPDPRRGVPRYARRLREGAGEGKP